ncbi:hypothetical protein LINPERPRIM_LOCUS3636 [Linum perenne]
MAALVTMLRRALPLGSQRILHIAAISRQQKFLTPDFSRIQQLSSTAGEPSADENLIKALQDAIDDEARARKVFEDEVKKDKQRAQKVVDDFLRKIEEEKNE